MALVVALSLAAAGAQAMTVSYQCPGRRLLTAEFSPRIGQLHFEGQSWTLRRVPGRDLARYLNRKAGIEVVAKARRLDFTHGGQTLACLLYSEALPGDAPLGAH